MNEKLDLVKLIKDKINIIDVIGKDQKIIKAGHNYKALCPFHEEKTPSFIINYQKQSYVCYGCGKNGDIFSYAMEKYKISFKEALEKFANEANIEVNNYTKNTSYKNNSRFYYNVMKTIANFYNKNLIDYLKNNSLSLLEKKKITYENIEKFNLGLASNSKKLEEILVKQSINLDYLIENNIFKINKFGNKYDLFTNRIMFPIKDSYENVIAFGGRSLSDDEQPKYLNSWENNYFKKRKVLYNLPSLNNIKNRTENVYMVEGYTDVIALEGNGYIAVAPLGTSLTLEQFKLIWKYVNEPTLLMDGDVAGRNASLRALELVMPELQAENTVNFIFLEEGKDPDDILNDVNGQITFSRFLSNKLNFLEALISFNGEEDLNSPERILNFRNNILQKIKSIKNFDTRELYKSFIIERINKIAKNQISTFGNTSNTIKKDNYFTNLNKNKNINTFILRRERSILSAMINNYKLLEQNDEVLAKVSISNSELLELRDTIIEILSTEKIINSKDLKKSLNNKGYQNILKKHFQTKDGINFNLVEEYAMENTDINNATKTLLDIISIQEKWYFNKNKTL